MDLNRKNVRALLLIVAFGVALFVGLWHLDTVMAALGTFLGMLSFFFVGLSIAFILNTPLKLVETKLFAPLNKRPGKRWPKIRRALSLLLTVLLFLGFVGLAVLIVVPEMGNTIGLIAREFPAFAQRAVDWVVGLSDQYGDVLAASESLEKIDWNSLVDTVIGWLRSGGGALFTGTVSAATSIAGGAFNFVIGLIVAFYVLYDKERLSGQVKRVLRAFLPDRASARMIEIGGMATNTFGNFVSGQFLEAIILGVLCFIGMLIFGFPFAPMVSFLVGVTAIIPMFGAFIGWFVGAFMILIHQGPMTMVWFTVFFLVLQQIEGDLIYPHVVGKSVMLPGLWVLVAATLGGNLSGVVGMFVSVPLASVAYAVLRQVVNRRLAAKRGEEITLA